MREVEQFDRNDLDQSETYRYESPRNGNGRKDAPQFDPVPAQSAREPVSRPLGATLPAGPAPKSPLPPGQGLSAGYGQGKSARPTAPPPGRTLSTTPVPNAEAEASSAMQWIMGAVKQAVPFLQRLLPLVEGNIATATSNALASRPHTPPPAPRIDLQPIEAGLAELQGQQRELRDQLLEHNTSLKRVEDHLDMVREATDRNTLEQQELIEDLKAMGNKVNLLALLLLALLVISVLLNLFLFLHIQRVLP